MKRKGLCPSVILVVLSLLCIFTSCNDEVNTDNGKGYISLVINIDNNSYSSRSTRAATREPATDNESRVDNVVLLFYTTDGYSSADLNMSDAMANSIKIIQAMRFESSQLTEEYSSAGRYYTTEARECPLALINSENYHALVVVNTDKTANDYIGKTIAEVRDQLSGSAQWHTNGSTVADYDYFMMSSQKDAIITKSNTSGKGTKEDPILIPINIERMAARIDFVPNAAYDASVGGYVYDAVVESGSVTETAGGFVLKYAGPINCLNTGGYVFRRVASRVAGTLTVTGTDYLGDEVVGLDVSKGNYVVDPWTTQKDEDSATKMAANYTNFGTIAAADLANYKVQPLAGADFYVLGYTMENTTLDNNTTYATGVEFRGTYYTKENWDATNHQPVAGAAGTDKTYRYFIHHSYLNNTEATTATPMFYGIVRNNVYKIQISKVKGEALLFTISVRPWTCYIHPEVII